MTMVFTFIALYMMYYICAKPSSNLLHNSLFICLADIKDWMAKKFLKLNSNEIES